MFPRPDLRLLALTLAAGLSVACARASGTGAATTPAAVRYAGYPGFDAYRYPGDSAMQRWRAPASPYRWVGYYLPSPCHRDSSWVGRRASLESMGWGTAVLYVGQQTWEGQPPPAVPDSARPDSTAAAPPACVASLLGADRGALDADDAIARAAAEGFAAGSTIFLDVERMETVPPEMDAYYRAWTRRLLSDGRYRPGTYAHARNVPALYASAAAEYADAGRTAPPPFWIATTVGFAITAHPTAVGQPFAAVWQGAFDVTERWADIPLRIDVNVAATPSPSAPPPSAAPTPPAPGGRRISP